MKDGTSMGFIFLKLLRGKGGMGYFLFFNFLKLFVICFTFTLKRRGDGGMGFIFSFFVSFLTLEGGKWGVGFFL